MRAGRSTPQGGASRQGDLRCTCLTTITRLGFGRNSMDRIANHKTSTVTDVYDRHGYADEDTGYLLLLILLRCPAGHERAPR